MSSVTLNTAIANKTVYEAFDSGWRTYEPVGQKFFNRVSPERYTEQFSVHSSGGAIAAVAPGAPYPSSNVEQLGTVSVSQQAYKGEIPVDFLMDRFDNYGTVMREATREGYRAKQTMDQVMADILLNTEGTTTVWDGLSLANSAHLIGASGVTQDNTVTGALSETTLNSADVALATQKDHTNQVMPTVGRWLVVPKALHITAYKLAYSTTGPETADRETGFLNTLGIMPCPWPLLDASNTVDWHLIADKMFNRLEYLVSVEPRVKLREDVDTGNDLYQIEFACAAVAADYLGYVFGNQS